MNKISNENNELGDTYGMWLRPVLRYLHGIFLDNLRKIRKYYS
jgi:hypothetical protein